MSEWKEYKIGELAKTNRKTIGKGFSFQKILYLETSDVTENKFNEPTEVNIEESASRAKRIIRDNDILISTVRPNLKHFGLVKEPKENLIASTGFAVLTPDSKKVNPYFLYAYLSTNSYTNYLISIAEGQTSTYPAFNPDVIEKSKIILPPLSNQQRIASILAAYDELMENNFRRIVLLELIAEQIYKEWFVRLRFPGWENTEFEKGAPKGWKNTYFRDFIKLNRGFDLPDEQIVVGEFPVIASTSVKAFHNQYKVEAPCVVTGRSGSLGTVQYVNKKSWPLNTSLYVKNFKGNSPQFVYYFLKSIKLENFNCGAGVPSLNQNHLHTLKLILPSKTIQKKFDDLIIPIFNEVENLQQQIKTLKQTRDLLLPRLISGKLRVKEV